MKKVIIVDDNSLSARGIAQSIPWEQLGTEVCGIFYDGRSVLEQNNELNADIIISDIKMPGISGLELTKELVQTRQNIKIILVSAYSDFQYVQEALRIGAFDYIEKPIDYDYLTKIIERAVQCIEKDDFYLKTIQKSRPALVENFFYNLTHSFPKDAQAYLKDYIPYLEINLDSRFYVSLIVHIENSEQVKDQFGFEKYFVCQMGLKDEITAAFQNCSLCHVLVKHNRLILIAGMKCGNESDVIKIINQSIAEFMNRRNYRQLICNIGIGNIVPDIWHIQQSYENAKLALEYRFFFNQKTVFDIRDCMNKTPLTTTWSSSDEERLIQILCKKDRDALLSYTSWLSGVFSDLQDKQRIFIILYSISNRVLKFLYDINLQEEAIFSGITLIYHNIDSYNSCRELCEELYNICSSICERLTNSIQTYYQQLCKAVLEQINQSYGNPELGLNDLALSVNISNAHLSAIFKNTVGISISDAITNARIEAARLLLQNTAYSIKEISERVGYSNQYYFSACFKKKTDMTPSTYRDSVKSEKTIEEAVFPEYNLSTNSKENR
ncbi:MAG: response regulator [Clostridiaceae bacterium]|nr:response regulator [Clostridiaceae bacterium]